MDNKEFKSPIERWMKKSFAEMTPEELLKLRRWSTLVFSVLIVAIKFGLDYFTGGSIFWEKYVLSFLILYTGWYYMFWHFFLKKKRN